MRMRETALLTASSQTSGHPLFDGGTASQVAQDLGLRSIDLVGHDAGLWPFQLHNDLVDSYAVAPGEYVTESFIAAGHRFHWLLPETSGRAWDAIGLTGHALTSPSPAIRDGISEAIELIAGRSWAMDLVGRYLVSIAVVESVDESQYGMVTSCSLPDFPLATFISSRAFVHIPPLSVGAWSTRHCAENLFHESVHQAVNHLLLTKPIFIDDYDSAISPRVEISWRATAQEERNRAWEIDRVLHAACVYSHLLRWRAAELTSSALSEEETHLITEACAMTVPALQELSAGLLEHIGWFTPTGGVFVGRLVQTIASQIDALDDAVHYFGTDG